MMWLKGSMSALPFSLIDLSLHAAAVRSCVDVVLCIAQAWRKLHIRSIAAPGLLNVPSSGGVAILISCGHVRDPCVCVQITLVRPVRLHALKSKIDRLPVCKILYTPACGCLLACSVKCNHGPRLNVTAAQRG
jgi:hypothetical protein